MRGTLPKPSGTGSLSTTFVYCGTGLAKAREWANS